jgi:hypothetical protein
VKEEELREEKKIKSKKLRKADEYQEVANEITTWKDMIMKEKVKQK